MKHRFFLLSLLIGSLFSLQAQEKKSEQRGARRIGPVVEYHLYVNDTTVNFSGRKRKALAINGQIPAPTLRFTEGDSAVIHVHNLLNDEVSIHWHGVLLPNEQDGVHVLNTPPIHAGQTHTFRYRIIQNGTLWYHSHTGVQEQEGLYGPLVFYPAVTEKETGKNEEVLQLSDWRDERGSSILRSLKRRNEWYAIKKKGVQSWGEAIAKGHFNDKVQMEWTRMPGADVSDVYYQKHLMHGQPVNTFPKYKKGDSVLLRVINGSAASYYWLQYSGGKMRVISSDGNDVKPVDVDKLLIATAETYDIMIKIPDDFQYEFRATVQDISGYASAFFGSGTQVKARDIPPLDYMVLMNEMNRITWAMKGMGMKMKMGLYMKMGEMDMGGMSGMEEMDQMNMQNENDMPMDHSKMDSSAINMNKDSMQHDHMNRGDTMKHDMKDTMVMKDMDHSNMPGMEKTGTPKTPKLPAKQPAAKKKDLMEGMDHSKMKMGTTPKKAPSKTAPARKAPAKKAPAEKTTPAKKPAPKKAVDHSQHGTSHIIPINDNHDSALDKFMAASLSRESTGKMFSNEFRLNKSFISEFSTVMIDTVPGKNKIEEMSMQGHEMHNMTDDTVPKKQDQKKNMPGNRNMQHGNMNMGSTQRDTSRSFMLMNMMPRAKMTGFDFPPGNGNDLVLSYDMLQSDTMTVLPTGRPWREIEITLSGNMQRYVWSINGKTLSQQDQKLLIRKGENVRVVFTNATMMEHPLHLHGHFFRVINKQGKYAPMKHTFNINAMTTQVIEFAATEEKDWFFHCHTLYHMLSGMATIFSYEGTESEVQKAHPKEFRKFLREHGSRYYPWANASFHSQGTFGTLVLSGARLQIDQDWKWNYKRGYELETRIQYFLDKRQFFSAFIGGEYEKNNMKNGKEQPETEKENIGAAGLIYTLPFLINAEARIDHRGKFRFQLGREDLPLTTRTRLDFYWNTDKEYGVTARYIVAKYLAISANYDSDFGWGAGLSIIY